MKARLAAIVCVSPLLFAPPAQAQQLGPHVRKIEDGIFVYAAKPQDSNVSVILTKEGVVTIDKAELKMPEFDDWAGKERFPSNVDAAWRAAKGS